MLNITLTHTHTYMRAHIHTRFFYSFYLQVLCFLNHSHRGTHKHTQQRPLPRRPTWIFPLLRFNMCLQDQVQGEPTRLPPHPPPPPPSNPPHSQLSSSDNKLCSSFLSLRDFCPNSSTSVTALCPPFLPSAALLPLLLLLLPMHKHSINRLHLQGNGSDFNPHPPTPPPPPSPPGACAETVQLRQTDGRRKVERGGIKGERSGVTLHTLRIFFFSELWNSKVFEAETEEFGFSRRVG